MRESIPDYEKYFCAMKYKFKSCETGGGKIFFSPGTATSITMKMTITEIIIYLT